MAAESTSTQIVPKDSKDAKALFAQAQRYERGEGIAKDLGLAVTYYWSAGRADKTFQTRCFAAVSALVNARASLQYGVILHIMGVFFRRGWDVDKQSELWLDYYLRALELESSEKAYFYNIGVGYGDYSTDKTDHKTAKKWYVLSALYGYDVAIEKIKKYSDYSGQSISEFAQLLMKEDVKIEDTDPRTKALHQRIREKIKSNEENHNIVQRIENQLKEKKDLDQELGDGYPRPLHHLIEIGEWDLANDLIKAGANLALPAGGNRGNQDKTGWELIKQHNCSDLISGILGRSHRQVETRLKEKRLNDPLETTGETPLLSMIEMENPLALRLIEEHADYELVTRAGATALHLAARQNYREVLERLATTGLMDWGNKKDKTGATALHYAALFSQVESMQILCRSYAAKPSIADNQGNTPLHVAASRGEIKACEFLLSLVPQVDINAVNQEGNTALHLAIMAGHIDLARMLLLNGANPNCRNQSGQLPCDLEWQHVLAVFDPILHENQTALSMIEDKINHLKDNTSEILNQLAVQVLDEFKRLIQYNLKTPLLVLIMVFKQRETYQQWLAKHQELHKPTFFQIVFFIDTRSDLEKFVNGLISKENRERKIVPEMEVNWLTEDVPATLTTSTTESDLYPTLSPSQDQSPPSPVASQPCSSTSEVTFPLHQLIEQGADSEEALKRSISSGLILGRFPFINLQGETLFHVAAKFNRLGVMSQLLQTQFAGQIDAQDADGNTPLHIAARENNPNIIELLLLHDADLFQKNNEGKYPWQVGEDSKARIVFQKVKDENWDTVVVLKGISGKISGLQEKDRALKEQFDLLAGLLKARYDSPLSANLMLFQSLPSFKFFVETYGDNTPLRDFIDKTISPEYRKYFPKQASSLKSVPACSSSTDNRDDIEASAPPMEFETTEADQKRLSLTTGYPKFPQGR